MRRPRADQSVEPIFVVKLSTDFEQLGVKLIRDRIGDAGLAILRSHLAEKPDQGSLIIAERPELDPAPEPLTGAVENESGSAGGLAGQ